MQNACACGHPLNVARADNAAATGRVPMLDFATINNRHGLETAVWMLSNAAFFITRRKCVRPGIIQQQEWTQLLRM